MSCSWTFMKRWLIGGVAALSLLAATVTSAQPTRAPRSHTLWALTASHTLIQVRADAPTQVLQRRSLQGLEPGESVLGMDFRVAKGVLYAVTDRNRLLTIDTATGAVREVGRIADLPLTPGPVGVDFNPTVDRLRLTTAQGVNARVHPDTGALIKRDADLNWAAGAPDAQPPRVLASAYTYNKRDEKKTTKYAIDARGLLLMQGSHEDASPFVSPDLGGLTVVGPLGTGPLADAAFDIADIDNAAFAAVRAQASGAPTRLLQVDLGRGSAQDLGPLGDGEAVRGLAIEP
jgi:DNA-binding beta-propeller fold protein YncE